ncbi:AAWKG family protein [Actinoallomurus soli]|uniref:AAWKG family protein n=1 Tax=Actinoallomurus soli TaxID=2952535 RepID=UPI0020929C38|nr:AAWKG family protein [Actinoallomurus soli]MCO5971949.1 AAWKG family protein [Actinoallomurus soli]
MADPAGDKPPASSANDHWYDAVTLLTGYKPPVKRGEIFKTLYGNDDIPLMKVEIDTSGASPTNAEAEAIHDMAWRARNSGWRINDTDFVVPFYGPTDDSAVSTLATGTEVHMRRARITLLGTYNHEIPHGGVSYGGKFGKDSHLMPSGFEGWDSAPLAQYSYGGGLALEKLMYDPHTTQGFSFNDVSVLDDDAVDLKSFDKAAMAFNRAALFFYNSRATIQQWEDALGSEDAAWRGQAAGVFWDIIHQLGVNYQSYTDALSVGGFGISKVAADLMTAKSGFQKAIENLYWVWSDWALRLGNPLRWLYDILFDVTDQIWLNNITKVRWHESYGYESYDSWNQVDEGGWSGDATTAGGKNFGPLNALTTWKAIGEEAISRWQTSVNDYLGNAAQEALRAINNSWTHIPDDIPKLTTANVNLAADYQADKAAAEQDKQDKENEENKKKEEDWEKKQEEWRNEDLKHQKELEDEQNKQRDEDKKHQQELEDEAKKQREEDLKHQQELEDEAKKQREEDLKHQQDIENEQRQQYQQQQDEAKKQYEEQQQQQKEQQDEAKKQYEQQQADQKAQEAKQEELQKQQQDEAKKQYDQQMAMQLQMRKEDQQKQDEQEKKQEELQKQQQEEAKQQYAQQQQQQKEQQDEAKKQYEQQQADQKAQEAKQEELQKQQQDEARKQYQQQQADQKAQEAKQEELQKQQQEEAKQQYAEQQKQQQEQEKKQEELQKQQQDQAQKQFDQQQKQYEEQQKQQQQQYAQQQKQQQDIAKEFVQPGNQNYALPGKQEFVQPGSSQLQPSQLTGHVVQNPDGSLTTVYGNDNPTGLNSQTGLEHLQPGQIQSHSSLNPDGTITTDYSDGSSTTINPHTGLETTIHPNGTTTHEQLTHGHMLTNPDGSQTTVNPDGTVTTHYPDGSYTTVDPKTGSAVTHEPNGETITTPLDHEGTSLPYASRLQSSLGNGAASYYEPALHDLPSSGGLLGSPSTALGGQATTPAVFPVGQSGGVLPPATRLDGTTTGGLPAGGQSGYPPMMGGGMGGMGGMGMGGGEKNGSGERVRQVYEDEEIVPTDGGSLGRRARRSRGYEEAVPGANFTPTSSGYNPYGGEDRRQTESGDREREAWVPEEEDVWGTDEGGAPAVIG